MTAPTCPRCGKRFGAVYKRELAAGVWPRHRVSRGPSVFCFMSGKPRDAQPFAASEGASDG